MINPKLSLVPAKNPPNFGARPHKIANCEENTPCKNLKTFFKIAQFFYHVVSSYQGENVNKALFIYFDRRTLINQN